MKICCEYFGNKFIATLIEIFTRLFSSLFMAIWAWRVWWANRVIRKNETRDEHQILWFNVQVLLNSTWAILLSKHVTFPIKKSRSSITCTGKEGEGYVLTYTGLLSTLHLKGFTLRTSFDWTSYYATTWLICIKISRSMSKLTLNCFRLLCLCPEDTFHSF